MINKLLCFFGIHSFGKVWVGRAEPHVPQEYWIITKTCKNCTKVKAKWMDEEFIKNDRKQSEELNKAHGGNLLTSR